MGELLPNLMPWLIGFFVVAGIGVALAVGIVADFVVRNRRIRVQRHESVPTYYGRLVHTH